MKLEVDVKIVWSVKESARLANILSQAHRSNERGSQIVLDKKDIELIEKHEEMQRKASGVFDIVGDQEV